MVKTESDIERDFYRYVKQSDLGDAIRGDVYRSEMRPSDAKSEDIVIKMLAGLDSQVQSGIMVLNLYVPDIPFGSNGRLVADKARISELQTLLRGFVETAGGSEYWLETETTPTTIQAEGIAQHIICARLQFKRITT